MTTITGIKTAAGRDLLCVYEQNGGVTSDPNACIYTHFDLTTEQLGRTWRYNCWAFTFLPRRYWIGDENDVDHILEDNCSPVSDGQLHPGDVVRYRNDDNHTTHTGRVWQVDGQGYCVKVRSKWGSMAEYIHNPLDVPDIYGTNLAYFRQFAPLKGVPDLWIRDSANDNGEQYSAAQWTSPDIIVDAPPYGGSDVSPIFGQPNHVWAVVHNRSNINIDNVKVRYYWIDPTVGAPPSKWNLIPTKPGYTNPTPPFTVPANSWTEAPCVEWTPSLAKAHQCLLAITYVNDDPKDSNNRNPIVYPFEVAWDNNIAARNVHVLTSIPSGGASLTIKIDTPFDHIDEVAGDIQLCLIQMPRFLTSGYIQTTAIPEVRWRFDGGRPQTLKPVPQIPPGPDLPIPNIPGFPSAQPWHSERLVAWAEKSNVGFVANQPYEMELTVRMPKRSLNSIFYLRIQQCIQGVITGAYTVVFP